MSVEILRRTAALMRERADKATTGDEPLRGDHWFHDLAYGSNRNYEVIARDEGSMIAEAVHGRWAAEHIASWHPAVALAVADLLDNEASLIASTDERPDLHMPLNGARVDLLLTVARVYLGEAS